MNNFISIARDAAAQTEKSTLAAIDKNKLTMQIQTIETKSLLQRLLSDEYVHPVPSMNRNKPTE
jgi:ribosomal protein L23